MIPSSRNGAGWLVRTKRDNDEETEKNLEENEEQPRGRALRATKDEKQQKAAAQGKSPRRKRDVASDDDDDENPQGNKGGSQKQKRDTQKGSDAGQGANAQKEVRPKAQGVKQEQPGKEAQKAPKKQKRSPMEDEDNVGDQQPR